MTNGVYTVSLGYESALFIWRRGNEWRGEPSTRSEDRKAWKKVWALRIPNKVKHFMFKCINGIISIKENLFRRKVTQDLLCPLCSSGCETFPYLFLECRFAQIMWRISPLGCVPNMNEQFSILAWFNNVIDCWKGVEEGDAMLTLIPLILWRIWKCQNEVVFNNGSPNPQQAVYMAVKDAEEFIEATESSEVVRVREAQNNVAAECKWVPPDRGSLKVNFDAAWVRQDDGPRAGAGMVIRGENGLFVAARSTHLSIVSSVFMCRSHGMQGFVVFVSLLGLDSIIVEGDSLQLVQNLENKRGCPAEIEVVIGDIRYEVGKFSKCDFVFTRRLANGVAHVLANSGLQGSGIRTWEARPPDWLLDPLWNDSRP